MVLDQNINSQSPSPKLGTLSANQSSPYVITSPCWKKQESHKRQKSCAIVKHLRWIGNVLSMLSSLFSPANWILKEIKISMLNVGSGVYVSVWKLYLFPSLWKWHFSPFLQHVVLRLAWWPSCLYSSLFCIYFNPFTSPFLIFFPLSPFSFTFSPFFLFTFSYFSPQRTPASPGGGGGLFYNK